MVSPNDHVVMNHQKQTPNKWHMRPCSLQRRLMEKARLLRGREACGGEPAVK
jgi:hypothetical protein